MVTTGWVYTLKRGELATYCAEFALATLGTMGELRRRMAKFIQKGMHTEAERTRLTELEEYHRLRSSAKGLLPTITEADQENKTAGGVLSPRSPNPRISGHRPEMVSLANYGDRVLDTVAEEAPPIQPSLQLPWE